MLAWARCTTPNSTGAHCKYTSSSTWRLQHTGCSRSAVIHEASAVTLWAQALRCCKSSSASWKPPVPACKQTLFTCRRGASRPPLADKHGQLFSQVAMACAPTLLQELGSLVMASWTELARVQWRQLGKGAGKSSKRMHATFAGQAKVLGTPMQLDEVAVGRKEDPEVSSCAAHHLHTAVQSAILYQQAPLT